MANIKISGLNAHFNASVAIDDVLPIVDVSAPETKKISVEELDKRYKDPTEALAEQVTANTIDIDVLKQGSVSVVTPPSGSTSETTTTNATPTTLASAPIELNKASLITVKITARRTSGGGSAVDSCCFILRTKAKNVAGIVTIMSVVTDQWKDVPEWDADLVVIGGSVVVQVTGVAGTTINWKSNLEIQTV